MNKQEYVIITFPTLTYALAFEEKAKSLEGRLIPTPSIVKAGCGMCYASKDLDFDWQAFIADDVYEEIVRVIF